MRMGVFRLEAGVLEKGPSQGCRAALNGESSCHLTSAWHQNDRCPFSGWQRAAYLNFDHTTGRSRVGVKHWEAALSTSLTAQLSADGPVSPRRILPAYVSTQTKDRFLYSWTQSLASLTRSIAVANCSLQSLRVIFISEIKWWLWRYITRTENAGLLICSVFTLVGLTQTHASN